jgi:hypothetical protein
MVFQERAPEGNMNPDYTQQFASLIAIFWYTDPMPSWEISIIVGVTCIALRALGVWMERHDARRRLVELERALCGEILVNHSTLIGEPVANIAFNRTEAPPMPFATIFKFTALEMAKANGDVLEEIPGFAAMRTLYEIYERMQELKNGGSQAEGLLCDGFRAFETYFVQRQINQRLILQLCKTCAPKLKPRLDALARNEMMPGRSLGSPMSPLSAVDVPSWVR